jgi:hypothetical protein
MHISGDNYQYNGGVKVKESYFFSKYTHIWGWATWRRAWKKYDFSLKNWSKAKKSRPFTDLFDGLEERERFFAWFEQMHNYPQPTWDIQWLFTCWFNQGLAIYPSKNLVKNLGFSSSSTNTQASRGFIIQTPLESIGKIIHPKKVERNVAADRVTFNRWFKRGVVLSLFDLLSPSSKNLARSIYKSFLRLRYR